MPRLTEAAKQERRARILDGARRCFARHGYEGATVVRLEQEIGLSRGAIFNWFPSKEALFFELAVEDRERLLAVFTEEGFAALVARFTEEDPEWLSVYFEFVRRMRNEPDFHARWTGRGSPESQLRANERILAEQRAGRIDPTLTPDDAGRFLGIILDGLMVQRAFGFELPPPELVVRLAGAALAPPRRRPPAT